MTKHLSETPIAYPPIPWLSSPIRANGLVDVLKKVVVTIIVISPTEKSRSPLFVLQACGGGYWNIRQVKRPPIF